VTPETWERIKHLFEAAVAQDPASRQEFLAKECAGDASVQQQVESLLASHERIGDFLQVPAVDPSALTPETKPSVFEQFAATVVRPEERPPRQRLGNYELIKEVGRGGMGVVYLAVRADDSFRKRVAIKLMRPGMDSEAILTRFRTERQILAILEHPHVARLLDGGTTEDGLPYLVMEYVDGKPLLQYCEVHRLSIEERLRLFLDICSAVQYAHGNLVVHRDLKPSNVFVTSDGKAKLLDFGIAKVLNAGLFGDPTATATALRVMTPEYASPEQIRGDHITVATDIYGLGLVLYELLTGCHPYRRAGQRPEELLRAICDQEPNKPSVAVSRLEESASVGDRSTSSSQSTAQARNILAKLRRDLLGDLDAIILRALRKEPQRRYASARELAEDIGCYLDGHPVLARTGNFGYRASKFVKRNKGALAAFTLIVIASLVGYALATRALQSRIAAQLAAGKALLHNADVVRPRAEQLRQESLAQFDAGNSDRAEQTWDQVQALNQKIEQAQAQAAQAFEAAINMGGRGRDLRTSFAALLYERALAAERDHRDAQLEELLARLSTYDEDGLYLRRWRAPARLAIRTAPLGASVLATLYEKREGYRREGNQRQLGTSPISGSDLAPGSYLLTLNLPDRPPVRMPILLSRGESVEFTVELPAQLPAGFIYIPAGRFLFGSTESDGPRRALFNGTSPIHQVRTNAYLISKTEVTFGEWISFLQELPPEERSRRRPATVMATIFGALDLAQDGTGGWRLKLQPTSFAYLAKSGEPLRYQQRSRRAEQDWLRFPVTGISWEDAQAYVHWLDRSGRVPGARLCDEREWERAARGADDRIFPHGDVLTTDDANFDATYERQSLAFGPDEVGSHPKSISPFGLSDMAGNVWELTRSVRANEKIVIRGGSWYHPALASRSDNREPVEPSTRTVYIGFRVCASAPKS
jgi:serine/threonine protein kinase/formylglycine-generating enzyme required for sulfatase activity